MTLISSIISDAFRESNILSLNKAPTTDQSSEALRLLQGVINTAYGGAAGEFLQDWPLGNYGRESPTYNIPLTPEQIQHPALNRRLIVVNESDITIFLSTKPQDGSRMGIADPFNRLATFSVTLNANGRTIEGIQSILLDINGTYADWFYRADLGNWTRITNLQETDELPFPAMFDDMFIVLLALRLNPRYGREMDMQSADILRQGRRQFVARYLQIHPLEIDDSISWPFMSVQSYDRQREFSSSEDFNRGF